MYSTDLGLDVSVQHTLLVNVVDSEAHLCEPVKDLFTKKEMQIYQSANTGSCEP